mgnify:CR=1 FL=1
MVCGGFLKLSTQCQLGIIGGILAAHIKLTDVIVKYAQSGKGDRNDLQTVCNALVHKGGVIHDTEVAGFQVIRSGQETISFRYYHRVAGKRKSITLGQWPSITVVQARSLAKENALAVANGDNPVDDKKVLRIESSNTLKSYLDHEYSLHMKSRAIRADRYLSMVRNNFPTISINPLLILLKPI